MLNIGIRPRKCWYCEEKLEPAPTKNGWVAVRLDGIHFDCIERLHKVVLNFRSAKVLGETTEETK